MKWFLSRLLEPSSHAGMAGAVYGVQQIASGNINAGSILTTIFGLAAFVMPETTPIIGALASLVPAADTANNSGAGSAK